MKSFNSKRKSNDYPSRFTFSKVPRIWSFHVVALQGTPKKCTKIFNARADPPFCSLNLLIGDALVRVTVVVWISRACDMETFCDGTEHSNFLLLCKKYPFVELFSEILFKSLHCCEIKERSQYRPIDPATWSMEFTQNMSLIVKQKSIRT